MWLEKNFIAQLEALSKLSLSVAVLLQKCWILLWAQEPFQEWDNHGSLTNNTEIARLLL